MNAQGTLLFDALHLENAVAALTVNATTGAISQVSGSPFLSGKPTPQALVLSPSGKFLYVGNVGFSSISSYSVDENSGKLTLGSTFIGGADSALTIDPSEMYLFSTCSSQLACSNVTVWRINATDGSISTAASFSSASSGPPTALYAIALP